ncbi:hypothetical protein AGLY_003633 [Aphis glycines]|uniref:Uncharacterized protein n=1 Tax=Aphis glycines TaxID=307491 RepID=A0A6G0TYW5_APHGL|nr:hypothetical protein AGLY_003633 [Aphis glycines]
MFKLASHVEHKPIRLASNFVLYVTTATSMSSLHCVTFSIVVGFSFIFLLSLSNLKKDEPLKHLQANTVVLVFDKQVTNVEFGFNRSLLGNLSFVENTLFTHFKIYFGGGNEFRSIGINPSVSGCFSINTFHKLSIHGSITANAPISCWSSANPISQNGFPPNCISLLYSFLAT